MNRGEIEKALGIEFDVHSIKRVEEKHHGSYDYHIGIYGNKTIYISEFEDEIIASLYIDKQNIINIGDDNPEVVLNKLKEKIHAKTIETSTTNTKRVPNLRPMRVSGIDNTGSEDTIEES